MTTYGGGKSGTMERIGFTCVGVALVALFIALTQPAWRGADMVAELRSDCQKVGGVMLEHKKMFGTSYECSPRFDQGVKR